MNKKILCLVEGFLDLGIAKSIQENLDCKLYGLFDVNPFIKKSMNQQKIVNFEKIWYFREQITRNQKFDLSYLTDFEKKYGINLWLIAFSDRIFYKFNKYHTFQRHEILSIFEQECKFYENMLNEIEPDFIIIKNPDYQQSELLYQLCLAKNIKVLTLSHSRFGYRYFISQQTDRLDIHDLSLPEKYSKQLSLSELQNFLIGYSKQTSEVKNEYNASIKKKFLAAVKYLIFVCTNDYRNYFVNFGRTRKNIIKYETSIIIKKYFRNYFLKKHSLNIIPKNQPFVYYPMHFQPERSTLIAVPFHGNQIEIIEHIAKSLPINYKLLVKEHPYQIRTGWRKIEYYKKILNMPNVELISVDLQNSKIIENCSMVVTIAGTMGLESAFHLKPSIVFSNVIYDELPSVHVITNLNDLPETIRKTIHEKVNLTDLQQYAKKILNNSFIHDGIEIDIEFLRKFFFGGFLYDVEIPIHQVEEIITKYREMFDKLGLEYIKKINNHKNSI